MNSYSENLHASVVASLLSQELNQKQLDAQLNASMFTLYYAEGAEIDANEKLNTANKNYKKTQTIKDQAVNVKNISTNLLLSANQQNAFTTQSVTNVAVSASNIQIATNAIVQLASDMGSILSIINAADYGTQIYQQTIEASNLMNKTAYLAEVASQHAMEASSNISEVSSSSVAEKAKSTDTSIDNLLKVACTDFSNITAIVSTENDAKAIARANTKSAEGIVENSKIEFEAAKFAYKINNKRLNYNLKVKVSSDFNDSYNVSFDYYKSPFKPDEKGEKTPSLGLENHVESYNLFLVKENKKSVFSISVAEDLMKNSLQHIKIIPPSIAANEILVAKIKAESKAEIILLKEENVLKEKTKSSESSKKQGFKNIKMLDLLDSDNEILVLGENYIVFLMVVFSEVYKKRINTYDDYLSAPSESFSLKNTLDAIDNISIIQTPPTDELSISGQTIFSPYSINFTPKKQKDPVNTEYRCIFLPYNENLFPKEQLEDIEEIIEVSILENEKNSINNLIIQYKDEIILLKDKKETLDEDLSKLKDSKELTKFEIDDKIAFIKTLLGNYKNALNEVTSKQIISQNQLDNLNMNLKTTLSKIMMPVKNNKSFYFNLNLAENIPSGNYSVAKPKHSHDSAFEVAIDFTTTDNFGNPLLDSSMYIPVILSYYTGPETNKKKYNNNLSDWENENTFQFSINNNQ